MYWVTPILKSFSVGRDRQINRLRKPYKIDDVQKYISRRTTRNMRIGKAGSGTGTLWRTFSFTFGKMGTVLPFVVARPFWCTLFAGILMESGDIVVKFMQYRIQILQHQEEFSVIEHGRRSLL